MVTTCGWMLRRPHGEALIAEGTRARVRAYEQGARELCYGVLLGTTVALVGIAADTRDSGARKRIGCPVDIESPRPLAESEGTVWMWWMRGLEPVTFIPRFRHEPTQPPAALVAPPRAGAGRDADRARGAPS